MLESKASTHAAFSAFLKVMKEHASRLEEECSAVTHDLETENFRLRNDLLEAQSFSIGQHPYKEIHDGKSSQYFRKAQLTSDCLSPIPLEVGRRPLRTPRPVVLLTQPRTGLISRSPMTSPRYSNTKCNSEMHWQPLTDFPMQWSQPSDEQVAQGKALKGGDVSTVAEMFILRDKSTPESAPENTVANRWALLYSAVTGKAKPKHAHQLLEEKAQELNLNLRPGWVVLKEPASYQAPRLASVPGHTKSTLPSSTSQDMSGVRVGSIVTSPESCLQQFTVHPDHKMCLIHAALQFSLILFDIVNFPLSVFDTEKTLFANIMLVVSVTFWTWDIIFSFLQGVYSANGYIDMRPYKIAINYLQGWFFFDVIVIALDWVALIILLTDGTTNADSRIARVTKMGKIQVILRGSRMFRLLKHAEKLPAMLESFESFASSAEWIYGLTKIFSLVFLVLVINHYIACAWYAIAENSTDPDTWITVQRIENSDAFRYYIYSLHWSLTQFTPCTNNIAPANDIERLFASCVVLFALVVFSTFLSSLTSATMQIKKLNWEWYNEQMQIRHFLQRKEIPVGLANRIWHFYRKHYRLRRSNLAESDIVFFKVLPKSIRREMHRQTYRETLASHPVMRELIDSPSRDMSCFLCEIVSTQIPVSGQEIFLEGDEGSSMYYFVSGKAIYNFLGEHEVQVKAPDHMAEATLWLKLWNHPGRLASADNQCELLLMPAVNFMSCIERCGSSSTMRLLRKYASLFAQYQGDVADDITAASTTPERFRYGQYVAKCSDLPLDKDIHDRLISRVFGLDADMRTCTFQANRADELRKRFGMLFSSMTVHR